MKLHLSYFLSLALVIPASSYPYNDQESICLKFAKAANALEDYLRNHENEFTSEDREKYKQIARLTSAAFLAECSQDSKCVIDLSDKDASLKNFVDAVVFVEKIELTEEKQSLPAREESNLIYTSITQATPFGGLCSKPSVRIACAEDLGCASYKPENLNK